MKKLREPALALALLLLSTALWAQGTAQISGVVKDESGAVLPGVTVTVTQVDTGLIRTVATETNGAYTMPNLPTGPYDSYAATKTSRTTSAEARWRTRAGKNAAPGSSAVPSRTVHSI